MNDSATPEAAPPPADLPPSQAEVAAPTFEARAEADFKAIAVDIEQRLAAIEAEAGKWLGGRHALITRHVAALRKLLL